MGLGRREFSQTRVVLYMDSSVRVSPDVYMKRYLQDWDEKSLDLDPANPPVRFLIRQLQPQHKIAIDPFSGIAEEVMRCRCGLLRVEGYTIVAADGSIKSVSEPVFVDFGDKGDKILSEEWFWKLGLTAPQRKALDLAITAFSEAALPLSKPSVQHAGQPAPSLTDATQS